MITRRLVLSHRERHRYVELRPGELYLVGRSLEARFFLNDASISRKHCALRTTETGIEVEDLASRNSCFVNGRRVVSRAMLADGAVLQIGKLAFAVKFLGEPEPVTCPRCKVHVAVAALTGPGGTCGACADASRESREARLVSLVKQQGFSVLASLGGEPPAYHVKRGGLGRTYLLKAVEVPEADIARVARLREEAQALAALDHEAITAVLDVLEVEGTLLVVSAEETGKPLDAWIREHGVLDAKTALAVARTCLSAVRHASERNVVHGEISPRNVLVLRAADDSEDGEPRLRVRLTNFSLARDLEVLPRSLTAAGELDHLLYLAPEVLGGGEASGRADIFGVGTVLLHALTGRCPWGKDATPRDHVQHLVNGTTPALDLEGVPEALRPVIQTLLAPSRDFRPATPDAALVMLDRASRAVGADEKVIQGAFDGNELVEFLELIDLHAKTGELEVRTETVTGTLRIEQGRLHSATAKGGLEGIEAAFRLLKVGAGRFRFVPTAPRGTSGLGLKLSALLLDLARSTDEQRRDR